MLEETQEAVIKEVWEKRKPARAAGKKKNKEKEQMNNSKRRYGTLEDLNSIAEGAMTRSS